jgi:hypothetical protein
MMAKPSALPASRPASLPDPEFFGKVVEPMLREACGSCHRGGQAGDLDLLSGKVTGGDEARILRNFKAVMESVDRRYPEQSALLLKGLPRRAGGLPHASKKPYLEDNAELERALRDFLAGATTKNRPPRAVPLAVAGGAVGAPITLDASATRDPEGGAVAYRWDVIQRPDGSKSAPSEATAARTRLVPDAPGRWVVRLRAGDGDLEALPVRLSFDVGDSMGNEMGAGEMGGEMGGSMGGGDAGMGTPPPSPPPVRGGGKTVDDTAGPGLGVDLETRRYARSVFFDLRARGPSPGELTLLLRYPRERMVDQMLRDDETWASWMEREFYYYLLIDRFRPVSDRIQALPGRLAMGKATVRDATREIVVSAEFNARNPGNDTFVTVVFEQLMGMVVQDNTRLLKAGKKMYDGYSARLWKKLGRSQSDIVKIVLNHEDYAASFVGRQYRQIFGTDMPKADLKAATTRFLEDPATYPAMVKEWLLSDAYLARTRIPRPKDDLVFIRTLFVDLQGREPTFDEFRNMRNAFQALSDPTPVRNVLAQLLLETGSPRTPAKAEIKSPRDWVRTQFLDLLGREPTENEADIFVATLGEYGCDTRTIVLALATSPDYQYY